jgi:CubicO group peptidase (beta-lactamase class C family)
MSKTIDTVLARACAAGEVPGVVALVTDGNRAIYEGAFGRRAIDGDAPMTADTVFWLASMTKAVTTAAAMQLVEQGKLELDAPIARILPELARPQVLEGFAADGSPRLRPATRPITLRHLLTHTAGFSYEFWNAEIGRYQQQTGTPGIATCENRALTTPLIAEPGTRWEYGINIDWAGKAVEAVSGKDLRSYLKDHLLGPLGMADTDFVLGPDQRARLAAMHARSRDGTLQRVAFALPEQPEFYMGGGGLYGTARDYLRFVAMILNEGRADGAQLLRPETVREMGRNNIGALTVEPLRTVLPELSNDADFFPGMVKKFGLGFLINTEAVPGGRRAGSLAWAGLANTYYWIDPQSRRGGVIGTQILPFADPTVLRLLGELEQAAYAMG